jgi:hypothetical protein
MIIALLSETYSSDDRPDIFGSTSVTRPSNIRPISQSEVNDLAFDTTPSRVSRMENSHPVIGSSGLTPLQKFLLFQADNPLLFFLTCAAIAYEVAMAVGGSCYTPNVFCWSLAIYTTICAVREMPSQLKWVGRITDGMT